MHEADVLEHETGLVLEVQVGSKESRLAHDQIDSADPQISLETVLSETRNCFGSVWLDICKIQPFGRNLELM